MTTPDPDSDLILSSLAKGLPGVTPFLGGTMAEAASVCMTSVGHEPGVVLKIDGDKKENLRVAFEKINGQANRAWADDQFCTEMGAYCIALLLSIRLTPFTVIERAKKGPGFDFWLGDGSEPLFTKKARLEVSGIRKGNPSSFRARIRKKKNQVSPSDGTLPAYVSVVEFSNPKAIFEEK